MVEVGEGISLFLPRLTSNLKLSNLNLSSSWRAF
jgi:hypothetical protein